MEAPRPPHGEWQGQAKTWSPDPLAQGFSPPDHNSHSVQTGHARRNRADGSRARKEKAGKQGQASPGWPGENPLAHP